MRPGQLKRRIQIERPVLADDGQGGQTVTYTNLGTFYAHVERISGSRGLEYEQTAWQRPYLIVVRQNIDVEENDTIIFEGQRLIVSNIDRDWDLFKYQGITAAAKKV